MENEVRNSFLQQLMDELAHDVNTMDTARIDALLDSVQPLPRVNAGTMVLRVEKRLRMERCLAGARLFLSRAGAACACLVLLFALVVSVAEAYRWDTLLRLVKPITDLLPFTTDESIRSGTNKTETPEETGVVKREESMEVLPDDLSVLHDAFQDQYALFQRLVGQYDVESIYFYQAPDVAVVTFSINLEGALLQCLVRTCHDETPFENVLMEYAQNEYGHTMLNGTELTLFTNAETYGCAWNGFHCFWFVWDAPTEETLLEFTKELLGGITQ